MNTRRDAMKEKDHEEWELKFRCESLEDLREQLRGIDAERVAAASAEDNWIYDRADSLKKESKLLRVRLDRQGARLTFKGPPRYEEGVKVRVEYETAVEDVEQIQGVLAGLGYEIVQRYEKKREEWRIGGVTVALDHTPIGDFVEFEGVGAESIARRCGFGVDEAERSTYLELYEKYRRDHPEAPADMVFS